MFQWKMFDRLDQTPYHMFQPCICSHQGQRDARAEVKVHALDVRRNAGDYIRTSAIIRGYTAPRNLLVLPPATPRFSISR